MSSSAVPPPKILQIYILTCFILFIFGAKTNTSRQKTADCHGLCSQHELIHETIGSILIKTWTPLYMHVNPMMHHVK